MQFLYLQTWENNYRVCTSNICIVFIYIDLVNDMSVSLYHDPGAFTHLRLKFTIQLGVAVYLFSK
jgi:hypothetical protein